MIKSRISSAPPIEAYSVIELTEIHVSLLGTIREKLFIYPPLCPNRYSLDASGQAPDLVTEHMGKT